MSDKLVDLMQHFLASRLTWRSILRLSVLVGLGIAGLIVYERTTSSFRLDRIRKTAEVLKAIQAIDTASLRADSNFQATYRKLSADLRSSAMSELNLSEVSGLSRRLTSGGAASHFWAGAALWILMMGVALVGTVRGEAGAASAVLIFAVLAGVVGGLNMLVSRGAGAFAAYFAYPVAFFGGILVILIAIDAASAKEKPSVEATSPEHSHS